MGFLTSLRKRSGPKSVVSSKGICVLGMHRSGTSCLTGVLQDWGVFLGDVRTESGFNRRGNRENPEIRRLNDDVLKASGGTWHDLPETVSWNDEHRRRRDAILGNYFAHQLWGFKDPRLLFTMDGWLEALPDLQFVGTYRHPLLVARSLQRRNDFAVEKGLGLWFAYNQRLLADHQKLGFPIVSFDRAEPEYRESLTKLRDILRERDLPLNKTDIAFFDEELRHTDVTDGADLPVDIAQLYRELEDRAL
jgi:hypothetical protein